MSTMLEDLAELANLARACDDDKASQHVSRPTSTLERIAHLDKLNHLYRRSLYGPHSQSLQEYIRRDANRMEDRSPLEDFQRIDADIEEVLYDIGEALKTAEDEIERRRQAAPNAHGTER